MEQEGVTWQGWSTACDPQGNPMGEANPGRLAGGCGVLAYLSSASIQASKYQNGKRTPGRLRAARQDAQRKAVRAAIRSLRATLEGQQ